MMKPFLIIYIYVIIIFYVGKEKSVVFAQFAQDILHNCKNPDASCYKLNVLLKPCFFKIDFSEPIFGKKLGLDSWPFSSCMCSQEFYNELVSCGNACNIPVDEPVKYESDCEIGNHPINLGGGGNSNSNAKSNSNKNSNSNSNSNSNTNTNTVNVYTNSGASNLSFRTIGGISLGSLITLVLLA